MDDRRDDHVSVAPAIYDIDIVGTSIEMPPS